MFDWLKKTKDKIKKLNEGVTEYTKDTVIQSLPSLAYVNKAKKLIELNKLDEAENELKKALELPQEDALAYKYLGLLYEKQMNFKLAVEMYQKSAELNEEDKNIWQKLGFALITTKEFERADKAFDNANKITPMNTDTFTGWGMSLMKLKNYEMAREKFIEASKYNRYNFSAIFLAAVCEVNLGLLDDAEIKLKFLTGVAPTESNNYEYANLRFLKNNYEDAILYATKAIELNPKILPAYLLLGKIYSIRFEKDNALKYYKTAEENDLINDNLYLEWGKALIRFSNYVEAKWYLLKSYDLNLNNVEALENLVLVNALLSDLKDIPVLIEKLEKIKPSSIILKLAKGIISYVNNECENSLSLLKETVETVDNNFISYFYMAKCSEKLGNDTKTKEYFDSAILKNPSYTIAYIDYAKYLIQKEKYADAQRKLRKVNKFEPDNVDVLNLLFHVSYILVKENVCEYNIKETIAIANKITNPDLFNYKDELDELIKISKCERDKN